MVQLSSARPASTLGNPRHCNANGGLPPSAPMLWARGVKYGWGFILSYSLHVAYFAVPSRRTAALM